MWSLTFYLAVLLIISCNPSNAAVPTPCTLAWWYVVIPQTYSISFVMSHNFVVIQFPFTAACQQESKWHQTGRGVPSQCYECFIIDCYSRFRPDRGFCPHLVLCATMVRLPIRPSVTKWPFVCIGFVRSYQHFRLCHTVEYR